MSKTHSKRTSTIKPKQNLLRNIKEVFKKEVIIHKESIDNQKERMIFKISIVDREGQVEVMEEERIIRIRSMIIKEDTRIVAVSMIIAITEIPVRIQSITKIGDIVDLVIMKKMVDIEGNEGVIVITEIIVRILTRNIEIIVETVIMRIMEVIVVIVEVFAVIVIVITIRMMKIVEILISAEETMMIRVPVINSEEVIQKEMVIEILIIETKIMIIGPLPMFKLV